VSGTGTAIVDFGTQPASDAQLVITGQGGILAGSLVEAWLNYAATVDHTADEHRVEEFQIVAGGNSIVPGVGFTIYMTSEGPGGAFGHWSVSWVWY
jgi:hypothetical protein